MQEALGKRGFRFANYDVAWRDDQFVASGDEGETLLRSPNLARLLSTLVKAEEHCAEHQALPDWFPDPVNPVLDIPVEGEIVLTETWEYQSFRQGDYRIVLVSDPYGQEGVRGPHAVVGQNLVRIMHSLDDCMLWISLAINHGMVHADASYRHYLDGDAELWEWNSYQPRAPKPDRNHPVWDFYREMDPVYGGRDAQNFVSTFRFHDYEISMEEDLFIAVPDDGMKYEFSSSHLGGVLFGVLEMLTPRTLSGRDPLWLPNRGEDHERVPDARVRIPDDAVPIYAWREDMAEFDGVFRSPDGEHCTMPIWWVDNGREVRAFTRIFHAMEWHDQATYDSPQEADLSYRLAIQVGTDNYPAGF